MMMNIIKGVKLNLSKKNRKNKAAFVISEYQEIESFKYNFMLIISKYSKDKLGHLKNLSIKIFQKVKLILSEIDWIVARNDLGDWSFQVLIEGATANFATHFLFGVPFNPLTMIAHGIVIKQGTSIFWGLRRNGERTEIPKKDK